MVAYTDAMSEELDAITDALVQQLDEWLSKPSPLMKQIEELAKQVQELKDSGVSTAAFNETLKQLVKAETEAKRIRQKQAAEAIAEACKALGVVLEAKDPPKRQRRKKPPASDA